MSVSSIIRNKIEKWSALPVRWFLIDAERIRAKEENDDELLSTLCMSARSISLSLSMLVLYLYWLMRCPWNKPNRHVDFPGSSAIWYCNVGQKERNSSFLSRFMRASTNQRAGNSVGEPLPQLGKLIKSLWAKNVAILFCFLFFFSFFSLSMSYLIIHFLSSWRGYCYYDYLISIGENACRKKKGTTCLRTTKKVEWFVGIARSSASGIRHSKDGDYCEKELQSGFPEHAQIWKKNQCCRRGLATN